MLLKTCFLGLLAVVGVLGGEMDKLMQLKQEQRERFRKLGWFSDDYQGRAAPPTSKPCVNGKAGQYSCRNIDLVATRGHRFLGSSTGEGNDMWGMIT